jgi:Family of unknown function (DUF6014)
MIINPTGIKAQDPYAPLKSRVSNFAYQCSEQEQFQMPQTCDSQSSYGVMPESAAEESHIAKQIVKAISKNELVEARVMLRQLSAQSDEFPSSWLLKLATALETADYNLLSEDFTKMEFIGQNGLFIFIAPLRMRREGHECVKMSAIYGQVLSIPQPAIEQLNNVIHEIFGKLHQPIPRILPIISFATCGNIGQGGEAFITPQMWDFPGSFRGPAFNDMGEQEQRFVGFVYRSIQSICETETAALLLAPLIDEATSLQNRHFEYQYHDAGHATGLGLDLKVIDDLFPSYWNGSVEEWRADGVEFDLAARTLTPEKAGKLVAVNLCIRIGLDAHRLGGLDRDADVNASLLTLDRLFQSGEIELTKSGQLRLRDISYPGLLRAVALHRAQAVYLTRQELNLDYPTGIHRLYGSVEVQPSTLAIFKGLLVERCRGNCNLP